MTIPEESGKQRQMGSSSLVTLGYRHEAGLDSGLGFGLRPVSPLLPSASPSSGRAELSQKQTVLKTFISGLPCSPHQEATLKGKGL